MISRSSDYPHMRNDRLAIWGVLLAVAAFWAWFFWQVFT